MKTDPAQNQITREIERKFLVRALPSQMSSLSSIHIAQGFIADNPNEVRLRRTSDNKHILTVKGGSGMIRSECEVTLSQEQFEALWPITSGRRLHKTRYRIPLEHLVIELDTFHGKNEGLVIAEVEFPNEDSCRDFEVPEWFGEEITGDRRYYNDRLAIE